MRDRSRDRRIKTRYEAMCLQVNFTERKFLGRGKMPTTVTCLDINRYGTALLSPRFVEPGTRLYLDFSGKYICETKVAARVVKCYRYQTGYRLSIAFSYCQEPNGYSRAMDDALSRIEGFYNSMVG